MADTIRRAADLHVTLAIIETEAGKAYQGQEAQEQDSAAVDGDTAGQTS
jgi:hypothetical protein